MHHTGSSKNTGYRLEKDHMDVGSWGLEKAVGGYQTWREEVTHSGFHSMKKTGSNSIMTLRYRKINSVGLHFESTVCMCFTMCTELSAFTLERM